MMESERKYWHALYVKSRTEKKVCENLKKKGFEVYVPIRNELRQWSDRKKWVEIPAISGYVFVCLKEQTEKERLEILHTVHVLSFVRGLDGDAMISDFELQTMRSVLEQREVPVDINFEELLPGQQVEVNCGDIRGVKAELIELKQGKKVVFRVLPLGCNICMDVPLENITKLP